MHFSTSLFLLLQFGLFINVFAYRITQIYPLDVVDNGYGEDDDYGLGQLFQEEDDYPSEDAGYDDIDANTGIGNGMGGAASGDLEPSVPFWRNSIGPFIYTFENANQRRVRQLWRPALAELNGLRRRLGTVFRQLAWDDQLARSLAQKVYTEMVVPMSRPSPGMSENLKSGIQALFQVVIRRYIQCQKRGGICRGKRGQKFRYPIELVDSKARRIGCVARLFKNRGERRLQFGAVCTTDRSEKQSRQKLDLFRVGQLMGPRNDRLRRKLLMEAVNDFDFDENDADGGNADGIDDADNDGNGANLNEYSSAEDEEYGSQKVQVKVQEGDILQAKVDAIVNPTKPSLSSGPQTGPEAIAQVLAAKSVFDVITAEDGALNQKRLERQLKQLANLVDPDARENAGDKERARHANRKVQQWQTMAADSTQFAWLQKEAQQRVDSNGNNKNNAAEGVNERIVQAAGAPLADKLRKLAKQRNGLAIGDAVATASFNIEKNYFAKKIIHTIPPSTLQTQRDKDKLAECYKRILNVVLDEKMRKIAFPEMLPPGTDENSRQEAAKIGISAIKKWLDKHQKQRKDPNGVQLKSIVFIVEKGASMLRFFQDLVKKTFGQTANYF